jgi:excisionase family DNA binding protein
MSDQEYLTTADVAALLRVNPQTVRVWVRTGKIPHVRLGRTVRIPKDELLDALRVRP